MQTKLLVIFLCFYLLTPHLYASHSIFTDGVSLEITKNFELKKDNLTHSLGTLKSDNLTITCYLKSNPSKENVTVSSGTVFHFSSFKDTIVTFIRNKSKLGPGRSSTITTLTARSAISYIFAAPAEFNVFALECDVDEKINSESELTSDYPEKEISMEQFLKLAKDFVTLPIQK